MSLATTRALPVASGLNNEILVFDQTSRDLRASLPDQASFQGGAPADHESQHSALFG